MIGILRFVLNDAADSRWSELRLFAEDFGDGGVAVVEDFVDGAADEDGVCNGAECAEREFVLDVIVHLCAAGCFGEAVSVMPAAIGPGELDVGEGGDGVEGFDAGAPVKGDAEEAELVVDEGASMHGDGARGIDVEVKERRRDAFEVFSVGEEGEDFFSRTRDEERAFKVVGHLVS